MSDAMLFVEDDESLYPGLKTVAEELGLACQILSDGNAGLHSALSGEYRVIILDIGLPGRSGMEICREVHAKRPEVPIVLLTGRDDKPSHILGLNLGADDYVHKPFSIPEVVARIRSVLRRADASAKSQGAQSTPTRVGDLILDRDQRQVTKRGATLDLTRTEYELLCYLFDRHGVAVTREELLENVWGYQCSGFDATITAYISRLRAHIEDDANNPKYLKTIRGIGYRLDSPAAER